MSPKIYLAGPDVFLPDPARFGAQKKAICAEHGLDGIFPLDVAPGEKPLSPKPGETMPDFGRRIRLANKAHIDRSDAVIANLTPFRGPSADAGTVWEVSYAEGVGKPVFTYSNVAANFADRSEAFCAQTSGPLQNGRDADGMEIERFGLGDNLMIPCAPGTHVTRSVPPENRFTDLDAFTDCVAIAARALAKT